MPQPITTPRRYVRRDQLLAAALTLGIPSIKALAELCDVTREELSRIANGKTPLSDSMEAKLRVELGFDGVPDDRVPWLVAPSR